MSDNPDRIETFPVSITAWPERRRSPRIEVLERIHGQVVALDVPLVLLDMSEGGFSVRTPFAFPVGAVHDFRFVAPNHEPVVLEARIIHTVRIVRDDGPAFVAGLEFTACGTPSVDRAIESLVNILTVISDMAGASAVDPWSRDLANQSPGLSEASQLAGSMALA